MRPNQLMGYKMTRLCIYSSDSWVWPHQRYLGDLWHISAFSFLFHSRKPETVQHDVADSHLSACERWRWAWCHRVRREDDDQSGFFSRQHWSCESLQCYRSALTHTRYRLKNTKFITNGRTVDLISHEPDKIKFMEINRRKLPPLFSYNMVLYHIHACVVFLL